MKKSGNKKLENSKSEAKVNLKQISQKLGITVPENLKNFKKGKMQDNEVVKHFTESKTNKNSDPGHSDHHMATLHVDKNSPGCPHIDKDYSDHHTDVNIPPL